MTDFETFWKAYPRRIGKGNARKAYAKALRLASPAEIAEGLARFNQAEPWRGDIQFCPHPSTWLNQERWDDEYDTPASAADRMDDMLNQAIREADKRNDEHANTGEVYSFGQAKRLI